MPKLIREDDFRKLGDSVPGSAVGQRLDTYLGQNFAFFSRAAWQRRISAKEVFVNGTPEKASYKIRSGDLLKYYRPATSEPSVNREVSVLWQEGGVLCAFKPSGLPMHESGHYRKNTFREILREKVGQEWSAVHRLDLQTSGIVLCGASELLRARLALQLAERRMTKQYVAIALGEKDENDWVVEAPISKLKIRHARIKQIATQTGAECRTNFSVIARKKGFSLLRALPYTGRTNQIRIHAAHSSLPLIGDPIYGVTKIEEKIFLRTCLHAEKISFEHPESKKQVSVESELPEDMQQIWQDLGGLPQ